MPRDPKESPRVDIHPLPTAQTSAAQQPPSVTKYVHMPHEDHHSQKRTLAFFNTSDGRDATLRVVQYSLRLALYVRQSATAKSTASSVLAIVSLLSALRRVVALYDISTYLYRILNPVTWISKPPALSHGQASSSGTGLLSRWTADDVYKLTRAALDVVSVFADNIFLASRLRLLPLSSHKTRRADRTAEVATLVSALLGLAQVARSRESVRSEGREVRKLSLLYEQKLDELEFWDAPTKTSAENELQTRETEEKRLRERIRTSKNKLKSLRDELSGLWWERVRLLCEATFATWDTLELDTASEGIKAVSGFVSAAIMLVEQLHICFMANADFARQAVASMARP
ncbi:hypothetical protein OIV83_001031 [Microbotryomycetes sp. JL201]|nr:hypothetical protein OIV83_001031 [Microbotryomycetes sp. JL201]